MGQIHTPVLLSGCTTRSWAFLLLLDQAVKASYMALLKLDAKSLASVQHQ